MKPTLYLFITLFLVSCGSEQKKLAVIGTRSGDLITVKPYEVKDTVNINISDFVEDIEIVRLETSKDALVRPAPVYISENYILTGSKPNKLFERKTGKFIGNVGNVGRGPGEYFINIIDAQIDEESGSIFMLSYLEGGMRQEILAYDLNGKWQGKNIPLASNAPKGVFKIDSRNNKLLIAVLPFEGQCEYVAWEQDLEGSMISGVKSNHLSAYPDYSNEVTKTVNNSNFAFSVFDMDKVADTLYYYEGGNKLKPIFNIDNGAKKIYHFYFELPNMFLATVNTKPKWSTIFVDKETLRGAWCRLRNDFLGGCQLPIDYFSGGYYAQSIEPALLFERLEPLREKATGKARERIDYIFDNVKEDDNNVVIIGKLKQ